MVQGIHLWVVMGAAWIARREQACLDYLRVENRVLREALTQARGGKRPRLTDPQRYRLARAAYQLGRKRLKTLAPFVTPDTLLRWHRELVARKYRGRQARQGRPPVADEVRHLVVRLAEEHESWGYRRIVGALKHLGVTVSASTVRRLLREAGLNPSPERKKTLSWSRFLKRQFAHIAAADFFTKEIWTVQGLKRMHVLVVIELITRRIHVAGMVAEPTGAWVEQTFRELTDMDDGFLLGKPILLVDRGSQFTDRAAMILAGSGVQMKRLPPRSPNLNAYVERVIRSVKEEALDRILIFGEGHLRRVLKEFTAHYHHERPHQGLDNELVVPVPRKRLGKVVRKQRLGGLLSHYDRVA